MRPITSLVFSDFTVPYHGLHILNIIPAFLSSLKVLGNVRPKVNRLDLAAGDLLKAKGEKEGAPLLSSQDRLNINRMFTKCRCPYFVLFGVLFLSHGIIISHNLEYVKFFS